jgi:LPXTG-motif cell wall-anchored protein
VASLAETGFDAGLVALLAAALLVLGVGALVWLRVNVADD